MENKVRAALIGVGVMGKKYAEMIVQGKVSGMVLTAVVARRQEVKEWAVKLLNADGTKPYVYANTDELFEKPDNYDSNSA